jgi:hypothetical protein
VNLWKEASCKLHNCTVHIVLQAQLTVRNVLDLELFELNCFNTKTGLPHIRYEHVLSQHQIWATWIDDVQNLTTTTYKISNI